MRTHLEAKAAEARHAMDLAQQSANSETKSSMGDKYETGRAMAQTERNRAAQQLAQIQDGLAVLAQMERTSSEPGADRVGRLGALVRAGGALYLLGVGAGRLALPDGEPLLCVSLSSPAGGAMAGAKMGSLVQIGPKAAVVELIVG